MKLRRKLWERQCSSPSTAAGGREMARRPVYIAEYDGASKGCPTDPSLLEEIVRLERRIFPKHESLARSFEQELRKKHAGLLYAADGSPGGGGAAGRGEVVGYVMYSSISSLCASITKLAVKESWRRQGHGEALLKAALDKCKAKRFQHVTLHVDPQRSFAVSLYKKIGFQVDELIEGYYSPERHSYRMCLDLNN